MGSLIDDEILNTFAVVGEPDARFELVIQGPLPTAYERDFRRPPEPGTLATAPVAPDIVKIEAVDGECAIGRNMQCRYSGDLAAMKTCTNVFGACDQIW